MTNAPDPSVSGQLPVGYAALCVKPTLPPTYSSWINQVERWFAELTRRQLRRGVHCSTRALEDVLRIYLATDTDDARPFLWVKTADEMMANIERFVYEPPVTRH